MILSSISLQNFRSYSNSSFTFSSGINIIIGPNTSGKTNIIEAVYLLSTGKSFRAYKDLEMIRLGEEMGRVFGEGEIINLEVILTQGQVNNIKTPYKRFLVNGVGKRLIDFSENLKTVLFSPSHLDIISGSPALRRNFLDETLEQTNRGYRLALINYKKALRQRNALLEIAREQGRNEKQFEYWDELLINNGECLTKEREELIAFINDSKKDIFDFKAYYDKSVISEARLLQYKDAEIGAGITLVGPHRDDILMRMNDNFDIRFFGSRGQQRLVVLQLKFLQLKYFEDVLDRNPLLLLDDIFSELDEGHIDLVSEMIKGQQTIITTMHKEFVSKEIGGSIINL